MPTPLHRLGIDPPGHPAPPWTVSEWLGGAGALQPGDLRGKVIVLHTFQMLCPACVHHGLPQMQRVRKIFAPEDVALVGLHTVFEHHDAMAPVSLRAFLHENRISFPVGIDMPAANPNDPIPQTMRAYGLRGTPSLLLIDRHGDLRHHAFGIGEDLAVGAAIAVLLAER